MGIHDGELANTHDVREAVIRRIREVRAETVVSVDPTAWFFENRYYNHSDHRTAGEIALDAVFPGAGNPHYFSEHLEEGLDVSEVHDIWLGWTNEANHIEDVSGFFDTKIAALAKHDSQLTRGSGSSRSSWRRKPSSSARRSARATPRTSACSI